MFTHACFIRKDTQELRDKLKEIGITPYPCIVPKCINYLFVNRGFYSRNEIGYKEEIDSAIDCGTNEELFLAIAALRDDTDRDQYFLCKDSENDISIFRLEHKFDRLEQLFEEYWNEVKEEYKSEFDLYLIDYTLKKTFSRTRKMTAEELIEYFKRQRQ